MIFRLTEEQSFLEWLVHPARLSSRTFHIHGDKTREKNDTLNTVENVSVMKYHKKKCYFLPSHIKIEPPHRWFQT